MVRFLAVLLLMFGAFPAQAADRWIMDPAHSKLTFTAQQGQEQFIGGFKQFTADILFNADDLPNSKIGATVDMASAYAGTTERDDALPGPDWFNVADFPQAQFVTKSITKTGSGQYLADATLTIRGISKDVQLPFVLTVTDKAGQMRATGQVTIMRNDFGVGQGDFAGDSWIRHEVTIMVDILANLQKIQEKQ